MAMVSRFHLRQAWAIPPPVARPAIDFSLPARPFLRPAKAMADFVAAGRYLAKETGSRRVFVAGFVVVAAAAALFALVADLATKIAVAGSGYFADFAFRSFAALAAARVKVRGAVAARA